MSDCETPTYSQQTITFNAAVDIPTTNPPDPATDACMVYLEYSDMFNRTYYSDRFCASLEENTATNKIPNIEVALGWNDVLQRLPVGVIDRETKAELKYDTAANPNKVTGVTIKFGGQQTGKQPKIGIVTAAMIEKSDSYWNHGLSKDDLDGIQGYKAYGDASTKIDYDNVGGVAVECSDHGVCDTTTGLCECEKGYGGLACQLTEAGN